MRQAPFRGPLAILIMLFVWGAPGAIPQETPSQEPATQRDLKRVRLGEQTQPWLRINAGGHTSTVRALAFTPDSKRLCSAGLDKVAQVWNVSTVQRDLRRVFLRERTIRWQVARGLRGSIYAAACAPSDGLLAIGGYGAMGSLGEIVLVDPLDGSLAKTLDAHRQTVCSLAFSADGDWLASSDVAGRATLWKRGDWRPVTLLSPDQKSYDKKWLERIQELPKLRPIAIAGNKFVILPVLKGFDAGQLTWQLRQVDLATQKVVGHLDAAAHQGMVTSLAATADGSRLASADLAGNFYLWDLADGSVERLEAGATVLSLAFGPDGKTLAAGTAVVRESGNSQLQLWDLATKKVRFRRSLPDHVQACSISPDGRRVAYSGNADHAVTVELLADPQRTVQLQGTGRRIFKVAFAKTKPFYRIAFGTNYRPAGPNDFAQLEQTFDTAQLALGAGGPIDPNDWIAADAYRGDWRAEVKTGGSIELRQEGQLKKRLTFDPQWEGKPRCWCWIPDAQGKPAAIAIGTDLQNSVYVYGLTDGFPLLRHFRGHQDQVTSVGVSRTAEYLVSGSADGTVRTWSLAGFLDGNAGLHRWGAEFVVKNDAGNEQLLAKSVDEAGPLYRKGLRTGDVLTKIRWPGNSDEAQGEETLPAAMLRQLRELPPATQVVFDFTRKGRAGKSFQLLPAWQPLATLFVDTRGEWAFWTPDGYYDASFNGHRLFGWQMNRGLDRLPDFYRADQFYKRLERPDVLEHLLPGGSLQEAFRRAAVAAKVPVPKIDGPLHEALADQISATPRVRILTPRPGTLVQAFATKVTAEVTVPPGIQITGAKATANGVAVFERQPKSEFDLPDGEGKRLIYEIDLPMPSDARALIQFAVETNTPTAAFGHVVVEHRNPEPPPRPRLFILALGINQYVDPDIPDLNYSVADAESLVARMRSGAGQIYAIEEESVTLLANEQVTPKNWKASIEKLVTELEGHVRPDDLVIFFLAGHGVIHPGNNRYYFVGHNVKLADFYRDDDPSGCLSWEDFGALAKLPCRKLALLDTCHAGAIQPPKSRDLKSVIRQLQQDVIFTVTASTGEQKSAEKKDWGHGAFTKCLLEALDGRADRPEGPGQGTVTLDEVVDYVKESVPKLTGGVQTPTAAPDEFLPYTSLPLTRVEVDR